MANKALFKSAGRGKKVPPTDAVNAAGGRAYALSSKAALARYAATGCLSNTFYVKAEDHLSKVIELAGECDSEFIAKLAIFARKEGYMKDMPALLLSILANRKDGIEPMKMAFSRAIDNGKMVRNFVQIMRAGKLGRKSLGTRPKALVKNFFESNSPHWLFRQLAVGQDPSVADIIKMVHPKGSSPEHDALFGYLIGKVKKGSEKWNNLPPLVKHFEEWKEDRSKDPPEVPFELLTAQPLTAEQWAKVIRNGGWHFIRMNLNTALRQGAFKADKGLEKFVAERLRDKESIQKARVMPYQIMAAYSFASEAPRAIVDALHDAMEIALDNAPVAEGKNLIIVDVSGSMGSPITGYGERQASKVRCVDVAALFASAILRKNRESLILPVDTQVHASFRPEPRDTIATNAAKLAKYGGGGTALSVGFKHVNAHKAKFDYVYVVSDQESWADQSYWGYTDSGTALMHEWEELNSRSGGKSKLVCIDIQPGKTHQAIDGREDIFHVSGWSDAVFKVVHSYLTGDATSWLEIIENIGLYDPGNVK